MRTARSKSKAADEGVRPTQSKPIIKIWRIKKRPEIPGRLSSLAELLLTLLSHFCFLLLLLHGQGYVKAVRRGAAVVVAGGACPRRCFAVGSLRGAPKLRSNVSPRVA